MKTGDRYKWKNKMLPGYATLIEFNGENYTVIESIPGGVHGYKIGDLFSKYDDCNWQFIGNFSKTDKFEELYNLMNS